MYEGRQDEAKSNTCILVLRDTRPQMSELCDFCTRSSVIDAIMSVEDERKRGKEMSINFYAIDPGEHEELMLIEPQAMGDGK